MSVWNDGHVVMWFAGPSTGRRPNGKPSPVSRFELPLAIERYLERVPDRASLTWIIKSPFVLLALGLWILSCPPSLAEDDPNALDQQVNQLIEQGKYQEAIPIADEDLLRSESATDGRSAGTSRGCPGPTGSYWLAPRVPLRACCARRRVSDRKLPVRQPLNCSGTSFAQTKRRRHAVG